MENLLDKFDKVLDAIKEDPSYLEYLDLSDKLSKNEKVTKTIAEIKSLQKEAVKKEANGKDVSDINALINEKLKLIESIPLYNEFIIKQKEVDETLGLLKEKLENYIDGIIN